MRWITICLGLALASCTKKPAKTDIVDQAVFGVFFGGQVQQRKELPFQIDPSKQSQGFRIDFSRPLETDVRVEWEIDKPNPVKLPGSDPRKGARVTILGRGIVKAGQKRFDHVIPLQPGDPLGMWNVRVVMGQRVLIDRPFSVFDPRARARAMNDGGK